MSTSVLEEIEVNEEVQSVEDQPESSAANLGGKYLTFLLDKEEYGLEILKIIEIIGMLDVTKVPQTPDFVEGVVNLRGKVIPVVDLRSKFGLERAEYDDQTCIIVVDVGMLMGIIVDTVQEVHDIPADDIDAAPSLGAEVDTSFILGMGKIKDRVTMLLDIERVLTSDDLVVACKNMDI